ncbi:DUF3618 domain-containing protein [Rhizobium sp. SIMBA_035]
MNTLSEKSSADLQREIDEDRKRIETRIGAIQEKMSPGQLVDEVIAYAKSSGGGVYVSNLGEALKENPLPVALMGVSLAWLVAKQAGAPSSKASTGGEHYPLYPAQGVVRRVGPPEDVGGARYSHFADEAGHRFKALTDDAGRRAGHFVDSNGGTYRGFSDAAGRQITHISDEAGALLDNATGWASDTWKQITDTADDIARQASDATGNAARSASAVGASLHDQSARINAMIFRQFRDQPIVGGALAFAVGAAIGAAIPPTGAEDDVLGDIADKVKENVGDHASELVDRKRDFRCALTASSGVIAHGC